MIARQATAVVGTLAAILLLGYVISKPLAEEGDENASPGPPPRAFDPAQQQNFAVLRGATQPMPPHLQAEMRRVRNHTVRTLWLDSAKYVQAGDGIWVVNGRNDTCIIQANGGAVSCVPREILLQRGIALGVAEIGPLAERKSREFAVYGIVPDQIRAIQVRVGGKKRMVSIRNNSYSLRASEPILVKRFMRSPQRGSADA